MHFSILITTDQRLFVADILPNLHALKKLDIKGEVLIATSHPFDTHSIPTQINPKIKVKIVSIKSHARAIKRNVLLNHASGNVIIFWADDFKLTPSIIEAHLAFHHNHHAITSICFGIGWIKYKSLYNNWLERRGYLFGLPFKEKAHYEMKLCDFFYAGNTSIKKVLLKLSGPFDPSCHFDCTDDWLMWKKLKELGCEFFHLPSCDSEHNHNVLIEERFVALIQSGWNYSNLKCHGHQPIGNLNKKIIQLQRLINHTIENIRKANLHTLFLKIEDVGFHIGYHFNKKRIEPEKLYSSKNAFETLNKIYRFDRNDFKIIENNIKNMRLLTLFKFYLYEKINLFKQRCLVLFNL